MTSERWQQIDAVLQGALARHANARAEFLSRACANDDGLRTEVESLLASHEEAGSFLAQPALEIAAESIAAQAHAMTGQLVGHYRIIAALGAGGMGEVYLAEDIELGRKVALKLLPEYAVADEERVRRFRQEARAASTLSHPNIAHIYEIGETDSAVFIVLEYIEGETLARRISRGSLSISEVIEIAIQAADALDEAHTSGITHRDIKSGNIMLTRRNRVKVLDFGLAKVTQKENGVVASLDAVETRSGVVMGTVSYMSPEQAMGRVVDHRTDIFSLGVVYYEMITGRLPFIGQSTTETIDRIAHAQPQSIARLNYDVPPALELIVRKMLRKDRDERYQSARDLLVDLKDVKQDVEREGNSAYEIHNSGSSPSKGDRGQTTPSAHPSATDEMGSARTTSSAEYIVTEIGKHRRGAAVMLSLVLIAIAGIGFLLYRSWNRSLPSNALLPWREVSQHRFATHGGVPFRAAISPDGKSLVYRQRINGKDSLWLGQVESNSSVAISELKGLLVQALAFSPDGQSVYVTVRDSNHTHQRLVRMPILGGVITDFIPNVYSPPTFSPDGRQLAFIRRDDENKQTSILIADAADGKNERTVSTRKWPEDFSSIGLSWSPDGKKIAVGETTNDYDHTEIVLIDIADSSVNKISGRNWGVVGNMAWSPDNRGVLVATRENPIARRAQIWFVPYPKGEALKITNDLDIYQIETLSLSANGTLAVLRGHLTSEIRVAPEGDVKRSRLVYQGIEPGYEGVDGLAWTPSGRLLYSAYVGDGQAIWGISGDGSDLRQVTTTSGEPFVDRQESMTRDGRYVVFHSNRSGSFQIWRANSDGSDLKQLTSGDNNFWPSITPDGQWIVYESDREAGASLFRVSIEGGEPQPLTVKPSLRPRVSPDGKYIAYFEPANSHLRLAIMPAAGGKQIRTFAVPNSVNLTVLGWAPDSATLIYRDGTQGLWRQRLNEEEPQLLKDFQDTEVYQFAWSFDGKSLAYSSGARMQEIILLENRR